MFCLLTLYIKVAFAEFNLSMNQCDKVEVKMQNGRTRRHYEPLWYHKYTSQLNLK